MSLYFAIEGFKSVKKLLAPLEDVTVLVGPPASGKSNLLEALALLGYAVKVGIETSMGEHDGYNSIGMLNAYVRGNMCNDFLNRFEETGRARIALGEGEATILCGDDPWAVRIKYSVRGEAVAAIEAELKDRVRLELEPSKTSGESIESLLSLFKVLLQLGEAAARKPYRVVSRDLGKIAGVDGGIELVVPRLYGFDRMRAVENIMKGLTSNYYPRSYLDERARNIGRLLYTDRRAVDLVNEALEEVSGIRVEPLSDGRLAFFDNGREVGPSSVSDTVLRILYGYAALYFSRRVEEKVKLGDDAEVSIALRPLVMLEEPEAHLYPIAFDNYADLIAETVAEKKVPVLLTTHSGRLAQVVWEKAERRGARTTIYYVYRDRERGTVLYRVDMHRLAEELEDLDYIVHRYPDDVGTLIRGELVKPIPVPSQES